MFLRNAFERKEFINARVIYENVELAKGFFGFGEEAFDVRLLRYVRLHANRLAALGGDFTDAFVRSGFAGSVIDDDRGALGGELFRYRSADAFGCASNDGYFAGQFLYVLFHMFVFFGLVCLFSDVVATYRVTV